MSTLSYVRDPGSRPGEDTACAGAPARPTLGQPSAHAPTPGRGFDPPPSGRRYRATCDARVKEVRRKCANSSTTVSVGQFARMRSPPRRRGARPDATDAAPLTALHDEVDEPARHDDRL